MGEREWTGLAQVQSALRTLEVIMGLYAGQTDEAQQLNGDPVAAAAQRDHPGCGGWSAELDYFGKADN